jgi:hypothetical protein
MTKVFEQTSNLPYDRHCYMVVHQNGKKVQFDNWEDTLKHWFTTESKWLSHVEVIDSIHKNIKGFK